MPTDLIRVLRDVLGRVNVEAAALDPVLVLPSRQYVTVGGSVFDCEQVSVSGMTVSTGLVSPVGESLQLISECPAAWNTSIEAAIVVCASEKMEGPRGDQAPSVDGIEEDTERMSAASAALINAAESLVGDYGQVNCSIQLGQPQGGLIATVATIGVNLWPAT